MDTSTFTAEAFCDYVIARIARDPSLIGESNHSVAVGSSSPGMSEVQRRLVRRDATEGPFGLERTSSSASASASPAPVRTGVLKQPETADEKAGKSALVQRAVVDRPLLPLGAAHLVHDVLWPAVLKATQASKSVGEARAAVRAWTAAHARADASCDARAETATSGAPPVDDSTEALRVVTNAVTASELASAAARAELAVAFAKMRRRVVALEDYVGHTAEVCAAVVDGARTDFTRKRPREESGETEEA